MGGAAAVPMAASVIGGAALGALSSQSGSGGGGVTESEPWESQKIPLRALYRSALDLPYTYAYPGQSVAGFTPTQEQAQQLQTERALAGSPVQASGQLENLRTTMGDYLYGSPGFDRMYEAAARQITPQISGAFAQGGRYGSGLHQEALSRGLGDALAGMYGDERDRMLRASLAAPALAQADYTDIGALGQVGGQQQALQQAFLDDAVQKYIFNVEAPYRRLAAQTGAIYGGFTPGRTTVENKPYTNLLGSAIGGGLMAYGLGGGGGGASTGLLAAMFGGR